MHINVAIHPTWLIRPEELGRRLAALAVLERPCPTERQPGDDDEPIDGEEYPPDRFDQEEDRRPNRRAPAPPPRDRGTQEDSPPADGRQLLGWASKQVPDMKGIIIGYGKKKGLPSKIVEWSPVHVAAAYRYAASRMGRS